jgi:hypothetical protein
VDWRGDGDLDIVTGQGHGGNGLCFYERDYINDFVNKTVYSNDTFPVVTVGAAEKHGVRADFDGDGDVDQSDFGHLQECLSGEAVNYGFGCANADLDGNHSVYEADVARFLACMSGANVPADPNCAGL